MKKIFASSSILYMNKNHFKKLINKSPYTFRTFRYKNYGEKIINEDGTPWLDEFGNECSTRRNIDYSYYTWVEIGKLQALKPNKFKGEIQFMFSLAEDSKIKMQIYRLSYLPEKRLRLEKYISYRTFRTYCKWGIFCNTDDVAKWEIEQSKINKEKEIKQRMIDMEKDFYETV